jgi:hypothetical protein
MLLANLNPLVKVAAETQTLLHLHAIGAKSVIVGREIKKYSN